MLREERAKQFSAFDALKGLSQEMQDRERQLIKERKRELSEEDCALLSNKLSKLACGQDIALKYYNCGYYQMALGKIEKISFTQRYMVVASKNGIEPVKIFFDDIYDILGE